MNVRPLFDRVLIERQEEPSKTRGGLFLPESAKEKPMQGKIIAAGEGRAADDGKVTPLQVKVGDLVAFGKYAGTEIEIKNTTHIIVRESELLGVIEG